MGNRKFYGFFRLLHRLHCPDPVYYWCLDRLTDNNGWRPLSYRERRAALAVIRADLAAAKDKGRGEG